MNLVCTCLAVRHCLASSRTHDEKAPVKRPGLVYFAVACISENKPL
jgi:hypothetical protein